MNTLLMIFLTIVLISNIIAIIINICYFYNFNKEDKKSKKILNETDVLNLANSNRRKSIGIIRRWIRDKSFKDNE